jgi:hypothetical protein
MKRIGILFEAEKKKKASKSDKPSYWRTVHGQHIGFDGDPPNGRPVIGPKQITKYLMVPRDESIEEGVFTEASIAKMNRKGKKKMAKLRPSKMVKPYASLSKQEKQRVEAIMAKDAKANDVKFDKANMTLVYEQAPYDVYEGLPDEVEYTVSCGGSGEDDFDSSAILDDYASGGVQLTFTPYLMGYDKVVYELYSTEAIGGGEWDDSDYAYAIGEQVEAEMKGGKPFNVSLINALVRSEGPDIDVVVDAFRDSRAEDDERDCETSDNDSPTNQRGRWYNPRMDPDNDGY